MFFLCVDERIGNESVKNRIFFLSFPLSKKECNEKKNCLMNFFFFKFLNIYIFAWSNNKRRRKLAEKRSIKKFFLKKRRE